MTQHSESRKEAVGPTPLLTSRTSTTVATWNIRTMYEAWITIQVGRRHGGRGPDAGTRGTASTRRLGTGQFSHHHSQVYHQEGTHQAEHYPMLCSHQQCGGRKKVGFLPATAGSDRQRSSQRHDHTDGRLQRQDQVR